MSKTPRPIGVTYGDAGVVISDADKAIVVISHICATTWDHHVFGGIGPFAPAVSLLALRDIGITDPCSTTTCGTFRVGSGLSSALPIGNSCS